MSFFMHCPGGSHAVINLASISSPAQCEPYKAISLTRQTAVNSLCLNRTALLGAMNPWDWFPLQTSYLNFSMQNYSNYENLWMNSIKTTLHSREGHHAWINVLITSHLSSQIC